MFRKRKLIVIAALAAALLAGTIGGVALALTATGDSTTPAERIAALLDRVSQIYQEKTGVALDKEALTSAFDQAQSEMQTEALKTRLQALVDEGKLTQDQADQYLKWWQSKPAGLPGDGVFGRGGFRGMGRFDCWGATGAAATPTATNSS